MNPAVPSSTAVPTTNSPQQPQRWTITTTTGETTTGHLPAWAIEHLHALRASTSSWDLSGRE